MSDANETEKKASRKPRATAAKKTAAKKATKATKSPVRKPKKKEEEPEFGELGDMLRKMFGGGPQGRGEADPETVAFKDPEPLLARRSFQVGDRVQLNTNGKNGHKFPAKGRYGVVKEVYQGDNWNLNEGTTSNPAERYDLLMAVRCGDNEEDIEVFQFHSSLLQTADPGLDMDSELDLFSFPERRDFLVGDQVQIDQAANEGFLGKKWPTAPNYGVIADIYPTPVYTPVTGRNGFPVYPTDVIVRLVTPDGDTKNFPLYSGILKPREA